MNKKSIRSVLLILVIILAATPINAASTLLKGRWRVVRQMEVTQPVRMAAFLDENFGVTGGFSGAGKAHYTLDGGKTWTMAEGSGGCLYGIEIVGADLVWVCGRMTGTSFSTPGGIRLSTDGGKTFGPSANYTTSPDACPMSFLDGTTGWFYQDWKLSATADGGRNWQEIPQPPGMEEPAAAVAALSAEEGYVLDETGVLYATSDRGRTWKTVARLLDDFKDMGLTDMESVTAAMRFFDRENGLVVMSLYGDGPPIIVAMRTSSGGARWRRAELVGNGAGSIYLSPDGRYITAALRGAITVYQYAGE